MKSKLAYRLPDSKKIEIWEGEERVLTQNEPLDGFVYSNFSQSIRYAIQLEKQSVFNEDFYFSKDEPIIISKRDYLIEGSAFLQSFALMNVKKAVYSRVKKISMDHVSPYDFFQALCEKYPDVFCYLISSPKTGTWVGATPEVLINRKGLAIETMALAATKMNDDTSDWNQKDHEEHQYVVDSIIEKLEKSNCVEIQKSGVYQKFAGPVKHLKTKISAELTQANFENLVKELHPTPAVCGTPRENALELITNREMHQRDLYTGFIGLCKHDSAQLFVNLRCAQIIKNNVFLYLGGGYVQSSMPQMEWDETENKALTLSQVLKDLKNDSK